MKNKIRNTIIFYFDIFYNSFISVSNPILFKIIFNYQSDHMNFKKYYKQVISGLTGDMIKDINNVINKCLEKNNFNNSIIKLSLLPIRNYKHELNILNTNIYNYSTSPVDEDSTYKFYIINNKDFLINVRDQFNLLQQFLNKNINTPNEFVWYVESQIYNIKNEELWF